MSPEARVIDELRTLFKSGATPSRLVRRIVACHPGEPQLDRLIRDYFRQAFGVSMFRASSNLLSVPPEQLPFAGINAATIREMVQRRPQWDREAVPKRTWMDGESVGDRSPLEQTPEFAAIWEQLDEPARTALNRAIEISHDLSETVGTLSRLVEQLQEQVIALEASAENRARSAAGLAIAG